MGETERKKEDGITREDLQLVAVMMSEIRRALIQSGNFRNFKRGQIALKFKNNGQYDGMSIIIQD